MGRILLAEESLDPSFVPPRLVRREKELVLLLGRYREALSKGVPYHQLVTGGIGSGKTALAKRLSEEFLRAGPIARRPVKAHYVNCWRRASDRAVLLDLMRSVGVSVPDRGYGVTEMLDIFEQGIRKNPGHRLLVLDEVGGLVRQGTKLIYLLTRSGEVQLGTISLLLVAPDDVLPYLDAASRSSFGVTHRLQLERYDAAALSEIVEYRASLALAKGSLDPEVAAQIGAIAAGSGDARFALELLGGAAHLAEESGAREISNEHVRAATGSIAPTLTEAKLAELGETELMVLLALARTLRSPKGRATTDRIRLAYGSLAEERSVPPVSRVTFWRTMRALEREGLVRIESAPSGEPSRVEMDDVPASYLATLLEERAPRGRARKP